MLRRAGLCAAASGALGIIVAHRPPMPLDVAARAFAGHGLAVAWALTRFGTFPVYTTLSVLLVATALVRRAPWRPVVVSIVALIVAWQVSDACKLLFGRPRPDYWFVIHEWTLSYPSGHATLVVAFYGFWTAVAWGSDLAPAAKGWICVAFGALALGIGWSRLALGAHYLTDVAGGYLLGAAIASVALVVYRRLVAADFRSKSP